MLTVTITTSIGNKVCVDGYMVNVNAHINDFMCTVIDSLPENIRVTIVRGSYGHHLSYSLRGTKIEMYIEEHEYYELSDFMLEINKKLDI